MSFMNRNKYMHARPLCWWIQFHLKPNPFSFLVVAARWFFSLSWNLLATFKQTWGNWNLTSCRTFRATPDLPSSSRRWHLAVALKWRLCQSSFFLSPGCRHNSQTTGRSRHSSWHCRDATELRWSRGHSSAPSVAINPPQRCSVATGSARSFSPHDGSSFCALISADGWHDMYLSLPPEAQSCIQFGVLSLLLVSLFPSCFPGLDWTFFELQ